MIRIAIAALVSAFAIIPAAHATPVLFSTTLSGANESPANASTGTGTANVTFDLAANTMRVQVTFSGLLGTVTAAHIHCCLAVPFTGTAGVATNTPTFTGFPGGVTSGFYDHTFDMTLASSYNAAFITANGGSISVAEQVLFDNMFAGREYLNIHTTVVPGGEIRGFLTAVPEPFTLSMFGAGLAGAAALRRRKSSAKT